MGTHDTFEERPIITLDEMKDSLFLKAAFEDYKKNYNKLMNKKRGIMTIGDMNEIIELTVNSEARTKREREVVEGFCETLMGMLKEYGNSVKTFQVVENLFGFKKL